MKACIIQPPYSMDTAFCDQYFDYKMRCLDECDGSVDIIVLPEYSDLPCATKTHEETLLYHKKYIDTLLNKCIETAKRCNCLVFVNALCKVNQNYRNTTYIIDKTGAVIGKYFKKHIPPLEKEVLLIDSDYTLEFSEPYVLEIDGLRYGFLTCYDFYFYEAFTNIAKQNVDIIIGCSLQRSDSHDAIEIMCKFLAYNTNAYVIRSSVSFDENSTVCGASMVVSPYGMVLANMKGRFGIETVEFNPLDKHFKPAGFGNPPKSHYQYIEYGRRPMQYRPAGSAIVPTEKELKYPRICAHRGFSTALPENTMPAFAAAIALGADEIEFDLWPTADGEIVSAHDKNLERVSTGEGFITEKTYRELQALDFGVKFGEGFKGLSIVKFENILEKFSSHVIMNIHVKPLSYSEPYPEKIMKKIVDTVRKYNAEDHCYFMLKSDMQIKAWKKYAPDIPVCVGHYPERPWEIVDRAIEYGCQKVQFYRSYYNKEMIDKAHEHGIKCNYFYSDEPAEADKLLEMGIDTILTNNFLQISNYVKNKTKHTNM